jgi:UDP-glucose 4-epimerase
MIYTYFEIVVLTGYHLIVGGSGFIGRHVAIELVRAGHQVILADRAQPPYSFPAAIAEHISWRRLEAASADWDALVENASVVHYYTWTSLPASANANAIGDLTSNVTTMLALLEALKRRGGGRVIFSSSGGTVYGKLRHVPVLEDHPLMPITAYGAGKATAEIYLGLYRALHGLDCRIARIANPYGAGQNLTRGQGAATTFLHCALNGQPIVIWGDGEVVRDYIHVVDVASAMARLALAPDSLEFHTFNIGSGTGISLNQIVSELEHRLDRRLKVERGPSRPFDVPISVLDISRARKVLGWEPQLSFSDGIALTLEDLALKAAISSTNR